MLEEVAIFYASIAIAFPSPVSTSYSYDSISCHHLFCACHGEMSDGLVDFLLQDASFEVALHCWNGDISWAGRGMLIKEAMDGAGLNNVNPTLLTSNSSRRSTRLPSTMIHPSYHRLGPYSRY
jgi:hypothetical protein